MTDKTERDAVIERAKEPLKVQLESMGETEVRLYRSDEYEKGYTYLVYVTPGHAERFADAVNKAITDQNASLREEVERLRAALQGLMARMETLFNDDYGIVYGLEDVEHEWAIAQAVLAGTPEGEDK